MSKFLDWVFWTAPTWVGLCVILLFFIVGILWLVSTLFIFLSGYILAGLVWLLGPPTTGLYFAYQLYIKDKVKDEN